MDLNYRGAETTLILREFIPGQCQTLLTHMTLSTLASQLISSSSPFHVQGSTLPQDKDLTIYKACHLQMAKNHCCTPCLDTTNLKILTHFSISKPSLKKIMNGVTPSSR